MIGKYLMSAPIVE